MRRLKKEWISYWQAMQKEDQQLQKDLQIPDEEWTNAFTYLNGPLLEDDFDNYEDIRGE